jgi:hypothetical protein
MTEVCQAFPGKFINVDVTEIADYGFVQSGTKAEELPSLMLGYTTKLRDMVAKHHMRLMINQCRLDVGGHLNGVGPVLDKLPKDIVVASYYTAGFYGGWEKESVFSPSLGSIPTVTSCPMWAMRWISPI